MDTWYIIGGLALAGAAYYFYEYIEHFTPVGPVDPNLHPIVPLGPTKQFIVRYGLNLPQATQIYGQYVSNDPSGFDNWLNSTELSLFTNWKAQYPAQAKYPYSGFYQAVINWYKGHGMSFQEKVPY